MSLGFVLMATTAALAASDQHHHLEGNGFNCASLSSEQHRNISKEFAREEASARRAGQAFEQSIHVNVYMHVITGESRDDNHLNDSTLQSQLDVLNRDYAPSGISFSLADIDRTINDVWASDKDGMAMRKELRRGSYRDLNLYFLPVLGVFGYCTLPTAIDSSERNKSTTTTTTAAGGFSQDGCTVRVDTVPGGAAAHYNSGKTAVHEVGHWFGLLHTFEGGCEGEGDYIDDTPAQANSTSGCPQGRDSCPERAGLDPIHNYMDYSFDSCYEEFTPGQTQRMINFWNKFRA